MQAINISVENFESAIINPSMDRPVVLTFTSSRYQECAQLLSSLEELSGELKFTLGAVNLDDPQNGQFIQIFRISGLPYTCVIDKGNNADVIQGVATEKALKEKLVKFFVSEEEKLKIAIAEALENKDYDYAISLLDEALQKTPDDKKLKLLQAKVYVGLGDTEKAKALLTTFTAADDEFNEAKSLLDLLDFYVEASKKDAVEGVAATYREACNLAVAGDYQNALAQFLQCVTQDKTWNDEAARKAMMTLFGVLGPKHALTWEYRAKLNTQLFI